MQNKPHNSASFGPQQGYSLQGDFAELNAELALPTRSSDWALQLWACDAPAASGKVDGVMVAEVQVDTSAVDAQGCGYVRASVPATLPVRGRDYAMVMTLARRDAAGLQEVHAVANFQDRQWVEGPGLQGAVGYTVEGSSVRLSVDAIYNPREGNVSGTLALELWAFPRPYNGRHQTGEQHLAGLELSSLAGQTSHFGVSGSTPFRTPEGGRWYMALLLREWTATGYVTRDYRSFDVMYEQAPLAETATKTRAATAAAVVPAAAQAKEKELALAQAKQAKEKELALAQAKEKELALAQAKEKELALAQEKETAAKTASVAPAPNKPQAVGETRATDTVAKPPVLTAASAAAVPAAQTATKESAKPAVSAQDARVSIQTATVDELALVSGITKKIAQEIVRNRPYKSLEDLLEVRGVGEKMLRTLRAALKL